MNTMAEAELHDGGSTSFTWIFLLWASSAASRRRSVAALSWVANVSMIAVRKTAGLMPPISSWPDMNSRAAGPRSHKRRIRPPQTSAAVSNRDEVIEAADQGKQCRIGHRLIPVIENDVERRLAPYGADHGTEDDGHPQ